MDSNAELICLIGESGAGKSTIARQMESRHRYSQIVTYTTRPMRKGERNGIDYHFISPQEFERKRAAGFFAESAEYNNWSYGTAKEDCREKKIAVVTPRGFRNLKKNLDIFITSFYIKVPRRDRLIKLLQTRQDIDECIRRNISDVGQFDGIEDEVDYVIDNENYGRTPEDLADLIHYLLR